MVPVVSETVLEVTDKGVHFTDFTRPKAWHEKAPKSELETYRLQLMEFERSFDLIIDGEYQWTYVPE